MKHILVVAGTRPEAIKLAPLLLALRARSDVRVTLCATGQHRAMLDDALAAFDLRADHALDLMQPGQHPTDLLGRLLMALRPLIEAERPDTIVVQGDTTTVAAAALAGFLHGARVAHVEAGLRTGDRRSPFPEEVNRRVTGVVADDHFAPTAAAAQNLRAEGVRPESIFVTGNTIVDALRIMRQRVAERPPRGVSIDATRRLVLVTAHRRESFGPPFRELCGAIRDVAERFDDLEVVFPVHLNPNVRQPVAELLGDCRRVRLLEPLAYPQFVALLDRAYLVLTDSGGVQEEAAALGRPTLVLRDKTERSEALAAGVVRLVGTDRQRLVCEASRILSDAALHAAMARPVDVYGDGLATQRICEVLIHGHMTTLAFSVSADQRGQRGHITDQTAGR